MVLTKHAAYFDPRKDLDVPVHIIGCGAIGSHLAEQLARLGVEKLYLYDFDKVAQHNIANQMFTEDDVGSQKIIAVGNMCRAINPAIKLSLHPDPVTADTHLSGYVFLAVDSIETRKEIAEANQFNPTILGMFDFRMRLTDAQHYAADWSNPKLVMNFINSMQFTSEEAKAETPVNACGSTLSIIPTIKVITALGISNFINFAKKKELKKLILIDAFDYTLDAF